MTNTTRRSTFMALMGAITTVVALTVPGTPGGADPVTDLTSSTIETPTTVDVDPASAAEDPEGTVKKKVNEATGKEETSSSSSSTTTSTPETTATTVPESTTTTTAPPAQASTGEPDEATVSAAGAEGFDWDSLPPLPPPPVEIPLITAFRMDEAYAGYTPVGGRRSTKNLFDTLARIDADDAKKRDIVAPFPVFGVANYSDDWGNPRYTPYPHQHEGCDVFATYGTPVIAPMRSVVRSISPNTGAGGNAVYLALPDGTYLYFAHLATFADGLHPGQVVEAGTVIGTVGDTGNAEGGTPHLHFEIHPGGGEAVPPVTYLDAWLASANAEANALAGTGSVTGAAGPAAARFQADAAAPGTPLFSTLARSDDGAPVDSTGLAILLAFGLGAGGWFYLRSRRSARVAVAGGPAGPVLTETVKFRRQVVVRHRAEGLARIFDQHATVHLERRGPFRGLVRVGAAQMSKASNAIRRDRAAEATEATEATETETGAGEAERETERVLEGAGSR